MHILGLQEREGIFPVTQLGALKILAEGDGLSLIEVKMLA